MNSVPKMTYYARVLDNITGNQFLGFTDTKLYNNWYYGKCNTLEGGESQYVIEFDIWNNEPGFSAGAGQNNCLDAQNCRLSIVTPHDPTFFDPFVYARCMTFGYKDNDFIGLRVNQSLTNITGSCNVNALGTVQGTGDHALVQTKIKISANGNIAPNRYSFSLQFYYDYE